MDRRYNNMSGSSSHLMRPSSFIPTSAGHQGGKMGQSQIQQLAMQSQLQAGTHAHVQHSSHSASNGIGLHHTNNYYQNLPGSQHHSVGTNNRQAGTIPRHSVIPEPQHHHQQQQHYQHQQNGSRTLSYSSHYGNTGTLNGHHNGNSLYGNLTGRHHGVVVPQQQHQPQQQQHQPQQQQHQPQQQQHQLQHQQQQPQQQQHQPQHQPQQHESHSGIPAIQPVINQIQQQHHSSKISQHYPAGDTEGLPPTLVESMRTLFDILDDTKEGRVRLSDIESRWENNGNSEQNGLKGNTGAEPLIKMGVMGYLRKVTPPDGMLTFDRFCSGLRLALLTNNNNLSTVNQNQSQSILQSYIPNNNTNPSIQQVNVQPHIKNMTNNFYSSANTNSNQTHNHVKPSSLPIISSSSSSSIPSSQVSNNSTMQRISKIPGFSNSRLPTSGSGIPISPKSKPISNTYGNSPASSANHINGSQSARRIQLAQSQHEQGTTVALVHQPPPPPNPKPGGIPMYTKHGDSGTLKISKQSPASASNGGFTKNNRHSNKNGSLDNLKTENEEKGNKSLTAKDRPPSAPILDTTDDDDGVHEYYANRSSSKRERARSRDREAEEKERRRGKSPAEELSFGKRVVSFVTPRQRTLSMPQLQLSKLKPKSISLEEDSSPSPSTSSHSPPSSGETKQSLLKSSLKSSLAAPNLLVSSIPTKMVKQKSDVTTKADTLPATKGKEGSVIEKEQQPPPPPKPPRNNALTISTSLGLLGSQDPPHSGGSAGSGAGPNPSKPEIRHFLQSWKKGVVERKPDELSLPNVVDTNASNGNSDLAQTSTLAGAEVKLRGDKKTNQRRRETPRRHTVQSGIDFATLKRLKQLEQERDVLQQGTSYLESAKDWYGKQLDSVDEKITLLTKGSPISDYGNESHEERLNLLGCRISEVNGLLTALMDGSSRLPLHMNLQIPSHLSMRTITRLKEQNRQLTQEVSDCSHRVTQLETEKAMLLRQLFHQKNNNLHPDETVYM